MSVQGQVNNILPQTKVEDLAKERVFSENYRPELNLNRAKETISGENSKTLGEAVKFVPVFTPTLTPSPVKEKQEGMYGQLMSIV